MNGPFAGLVKCLSRVAKREDGYLLPIVTIVMVLGSLFIVPSLGYISTSFRSGELIEEKMRGLYAAEAGAEDALWRLKYDVPATFPHSYQLTGINGMTVDVVIDVASTIAGTDVGSSGTHDEYLLIEKSVTYDSGTYYYTLTATNNGTGNVKVEMMLIDLSPGLEYVPLSTGGDLCVGDPTVAGNPDTGITLIWEFLPPNPTIPEATTRVHTFELTGPPDIPGVEGHVCVRATRQDVGTVWDVDSRPFSVTAEARDASYAVVVTIRVGLWEGDEMIISCWQLSQ